MTTHSDLLAALRIAPTAEESDVLAALKRRHSGERLYSDAIGYLTGRVQHVAMPGVGRSADSPAGYLVLVDDADALTCALAADWITEAAELTGRPPIDIRPVGPDEEPATYRVDPPMRTPVEAPQWLRNVTRRAFEVAGDIEADVAEMDSEDLDRLIAAGVDCARLIRARAELAKEAC